MSLYTVAVFVHIVCACIWLGGMVFLVGALLPVAKQPPFAPHLLLLIDRTGRRFRTLGWLGFALFLATGIVALGARGFTWADAWSGRLWQGAWGERLALKLALVAVMLVLQALHDFWLGPQAVANAEHANDAGVPNPHPTSPLMRSARWIGRVNFLLTLAVIWLAVRLVRG